MILFIKFHRSMLKSQFLLVKTVFSEKKIFFDDQYLSFF